MSKPTIIHKWNNVNYDYPSCGGTIGVVYSDGSVVIEHLSNYQGQCTGDISVWRLHQDALKIIADDVNTGYNDCNTYDTMLQGQGIAYIADIDMTDKRRRNGRKVR